MEKCKDCSQEFKPVLVFGVKTKRCEKCKIEKGTKYVAPIISKRQTYETCNHNSLNPGGYCNVCGNGRDFS